MSYFRASKVRKADASEAAPSGLATVTDPADLCCALDAQGFPDTYEQAQKVLAGYGKWASRDTYYEARQMHHCP